MHADLSEYNILYYKVCVWCVCGACVLICVRKYASMHYKSGTLLVLVLVSPNQLAVMFCFFLFLPSFFFFFFSLLHFLLCSRGGEK